MFCSQCGTKLDENNKCPNPNCPSNATENLNSQEKEDINTTSNTFNELKVQAVNTENVDSNVNQDNDFNQNADYNNQQNNSFNQNAGYNNQQNNGFNQNAGYNNQQNKSFNQNAGYNNQQNKGFNQNAGYNNQQNNGFNQNAGYNNQQNNGFNHNASYGFNSDPNFRDHNGISRQEMFDFIGEKSPEYYLRRWEESQSNPKFISWNWAAFLFNIMWFFYRKVYSIGAILLAVNLFSFFLPFMGGGFSSFAITRLVNLGIMIFSGLMGNQLYIKHAVEKIKSIKMSIPGLDPRLLQERLRSNGGITWIPLIIIIVIYIVFIIILIAIVSAVFSSMVPYHYSSYYYW